MVLCVLATYKYGVNIFISGISKDSWQKTLYIRILYYYALFRIIQCIRYYKEKMKRFQNFLAFARSSKSMCHLSFCILMNRNSPLEMRYEEMEWVTWMHLKVRISDSHKSIEAFKSMYVQLKNILSPFAHHMF